MAGKPKRRRRAYLDDFVRDVSGQYVYRGCRYCFDRDERSARMFRIRVGVLAVITAVFVVLQECFDPVDMSRSYWTIVPWLFQVIAVSMTVWSAFRLLIHFRELRAYVYEATVKRLPRLCWASVAAAGVTLVAEIIYIVVCGAGDNALLTLVRPLSALFVALAAFLLYCAVSRGRWRKIV